jgi:hypothetical protein
VAATGHSVYLGEFARAQIAAEEVHNMEITKMLRDYDHLPPTGQSKL